MKSVLGYYEYVGNLHIHTTYSDGTGSVDDIVKAAIAAGLDFIGINDHNTLAAKKAGEEGYRKEILVIVGSEVNYKKNHFLAYCINKPIRPDDDNLQPVIDDVHAQGGFGILAHPFEKGSKYIEGGTHYPWTDQTAQGFDGICAWNMLSQWRDSFTSIPAIFYYGLLNPGAALQGPSKEAMQLLDSESMKRKIMIIGGSDAHAIKLGFGPLKFTFGSYQYSFNCVNVHVLTKQPLSGKAEQDTNVLMTSIKEGRSFVSLDLLDSTRGFRFLVSSGDERWTMGETVNLYQNHESLNLKVITPRRKECIIKLIRNGKVHTLTKGTELNLKITEPGVYRTELYLTRLFQSRPWIISNPIWVN